jgi:hypothetical protein
LPHYKHKDKGRNILPYDMQAISKKALKRGIIAPSGLPIEVKTKQPVTKLIRCGSSRVWMDMWWKWSIKDKTHQR